MIIKGIHKHLLTGLAVVMLLLPLQGQVATYPDHIAYDVKAERIPFSSDSVKLTWKMNSNFTGEFVVGRSESEFKTREDILKAKLIGVFYAGQEGFLIDRDLQQGKNYYYTVLSKSHLLKREIDIMKDVNCTGTPIFIYSEPDIVTELKAVESQIKAREDALLS